MIEVRVTRQALNEVAATVLAVGIFSGDDAPESLGGVISVADSGFSGKESGTTLIYVGDEHPAPRILLVGLGERDAFTLEKLRRASARAVREARATKSREVAFSLPDWDGADDESAARAAAEGAVLGLYRFTRYKTEVEEEVGPESFDLVCGEEADEDSVQRGAKIGEKVAAGTTLARNLVNEPPNTATPEYVAETAGEIAERYGMDLTVLDRSGIESEGLTGLATVGRSARNEPRFIVMEHRKGGDASTIVLVGKAVTFDSGGIDTKPAGGMEMMKYDMSGGSAVLGAMETVGALDLPLNVVALIPSTENLPGGDAFRPGDVLRMHSGKTVEVITTDAEGRLIISDALSYARRYEPAAVIDCATLTGACITALGVHASGLMGNDEDLIAEVRAAGDATGERAWPLPLYKEYTEQIKGDVADIKNSGHDSSGDPAGAMTAGAFLKEFADYPWAHLDIAGTAWDAVGNSYTPKGATGVPTRLLVEFLRNRAKT